MRVIITRAENEAANMAELVEGIGCEPMLAPMMEIEYADQPIDLEGIQAVVATSANAVRALAHVSDRRDITLFCVGPPTQKIAESLGFTDARSSYGSFKNLGNFVSREASPSDGPLLFLHGANVAGNPVQDLGKAGFRTLARKVYGAAPIKTLPQNVQEAFESDHVPEFATFMSIRTFKLFRQVMEREGLLPKLRGTIAVCISPAVADFAREIRWKKVHSATELSAPSIVQKIAELKESVGAAS